jgi:hypothetical protein
VDEAASDLVPTWCVRFELACQSVDQRGRSLIPIRTVIFSWAEGKPSGCGGSRGDRGAEMKEGLGLVVCRVGVDVFALICTR